MRSITGQRPRRAAPLAAIALTLGLVVAGCGDGDGRAEPVGEELGGSVAQLAQCSDWVGAAESQKLATIEDIRSHVNQQNSGVTASALTDDEALEVFDNGCANPGAESFRLYVMYARAAAFEPLRRVAEGK